MLKEQATHSRAMHSKAPPSQQLVFNTWVRWGWCRCSNLKLVLVLVPASLQKCASVLRGKAKQRKAMRSSSGQLLLSTMLHPSAVAPATPRQQLDTAMHNRQECVTARICVCPECATAAPTQPLTAVSGCYLCRCRHHCRSMLQC